VADKLRQELRMKLALKQKREGKKAVTDAGRRRWELPEKGKGWQHWEVPFDIDPDYPDSLKKAVEAYRAAWRAKMDEVNACIAANTDQEELVDQPEIDRKITRVSGPFTVEAVQPPEMSLGDAIEVETGKFAGEPEELETTFVVREVQMGETPQNVEAYLSKMVDLLRMDGVRFPVNKQRKFTRLDPIYAEGRSGGIHAEGRWVNEGETDDDPNGAATVGVVFGPQYGPITAKMVEEVIRPAARRCDDLVFASFSFDGPAQAAIEEGHPRLRIHIAHIRPDVNPGMNGLLKEQPGSQLFTVFGRPRTELLGPDKDGMYRIEMQGVDIYDPVTNNIVDAGAAKVAAWFVDGDYDGRTYCITQAFFPDRSAWDKLSKALNGVVDPERFEALSGTVSLPFPAGKYKCAAAGFQRRGRTSWMQGNIHKCSPESGVRAQRSVFGEEVRPEIRGGDESRCLPEDSLQGALVEIVMAGNDQGLAGPFRGQAAELDMAAALVMDGEAKRAEDGEDLAPGQRTQAAHQAAASSSKVASTTGRSARPRSERSSSLRKRATLSSMFLTSSSSEEASVTMGNSRHSAIYLRSPRRMATWMVRFIAVSSPFHS
jgi:hypothetical protein